MRVTLEAEAGTPKGRLVVSPGEVLRIGRHAPADLTVSDDPFVSGLHFLLECAENSCRIADVGSRNGTFLNGNRIQEAILHDGDLISAGQTRFRVRIKSGAGEPLPDLSVPDTSAPAAATLILKSPPPDPLDILSALPGEHLFALLDAARADRVLELLRESKERYQSLYEGQQGEDLANFAPYLVELPKGSPLLATLIREGWGKSWGVYLTSDKAFEEVRRHFRHFLLVQTEDGRELYFRFYDPRVLRNFLPACTREEGARFWGPVSRFLLEGTRLSELLQFLAGKKTGIQDTKAPLGFISRHQCQAVERGLFLSKLHEFLAGRIRAPRIRRALEDRESVFEIWNQLLDTIPASAEYRTAIVLAYALCRKCSGLEPLEAVSQLLQGPDPEFTAKSYFEDSGACRFSEFDL